MLVIDTEVYKDYFLLAAKHLGSGKIKTFEMYAGHQPDLPAIKKLMQSTTISFNGLNFDLILIAALLDGADCAKLKSICDTIIKGKQPGWLVAKNLKINLNRAWDHIDLIEVAPGRVSLKVYGARLGCATLQDLPIEPGASISPAQRRLLVDYCANDLALTELLYDQLRPQIALREKMGDQYGMDLRSKSDAQIAETIITSELERLTRTLLPNQTPAALSFIIKTPALSRLKHQPCRSCCNASWRPRLRWAATGRWSCPSGYATARSALATVITKWASVACTPARRRST
jgi:hypothetical protein